MTCGERRCWAEFNETVSKDQWEFNLLRVSLIYCQLFFNNKKNEAVADKVSG